MSEYAILCIVLAAQDAKKCLLLSLANQCSGRNSMERYFYHLETFKTQTKSNKSGILKCQLHNHHRNPRSALHLKHFETLALCSAVESHGRNRSLPFAHSAGIIRDRQISAAGAHIIHAESHVAVDKRGTLALDRCFASGTPTHSGLITARPGRRRARPYGPAGD